MCLALKVRNDFSSIFLFSSPFLFSGNFLLSISFSFFDINNFICDCSRPAQPEPKGLLVHAKVLYAMVAKLFSSDRLYQYQPLLEGQIRLFRLQPANEACLRLELKTVELDDPSRPAFTALSYTWDNQAPSYPCYVDGGGLLLVTRNVELFLRQFYYNRVFGLRSVVDVTSWLWIDGLCVNQGNISERNTQVSMMKDIYIAADSITIWLGDPTAETERAFEYIRALQVAANGPDKTMPAPSALEDVIGRGYWRRSWVLQEATTPKPADKQIVLCGPHHVTLSNVMRAVERHYTGDYTGDYSGNAQAIYNLQAMMTLRAYDDTSIAFSDILPLIGMLRASDFRDRLFAPSQLCRDLGGFVADYSLSDEDVKLRFAVQNITQTGTLDILTYSGKRVPRHYSNSRPTDPTPSWVPPWILDNLHTFQRVWDFLNFEPTQLTRQIEPQSVDPDTVKLLTQGVLPLSCYCIGFFHPKIEKGLSKDRTSDFNVLCKNPVTARGYSEHPGGYVNGSAIWRAVAPFIDHETFVWDFPSHVFCAAGTQHLLVLRERHRPPSSKLRNRGIVNSAARWEFLGACLLTETKGPRTFAKLEVLREVCSKTAWNDSLESLERKCSLYEAWHQSWDEIGIEKLTKANCKAKWTRLLVE